MNKIHLIHIFFSLSLVMFCFSKWPSYAQIPESDLDHELFHVRQKVEQKSDSSKHYIEALVTEIGQLDNNELKSQYLLEIAQISRKSRLYNFAIKIDSQVVISANISSDQRALAYSGLGQTYRLRKKYDISLSHYKESIKYATDSLTLFKAFNLLGTLQVYSLQNYNEVIQILIDRSFKSVDAVQESKRSRLIGKCYYELAKQNKDQEMFRMSLEYFFAAHDLVKDTNEYHEKRMSLSGVVNSYLNLGEFPEAIAVLLKVAECDDNMINVSPVQYEYSCSLNALFGSAYFSVGELEKAVYRYKKAFELSLNTDYNFWKVKYANLTGQILKDLRRHKESIEFLLKLLPLAKEYGINTYTYKTLISLGYRYMYLGDFQNSIIYFNKAIDYSKNESILRRANAYTSIGEAYYKFGKETEAKKAYRQAKEMFNSDDLSLKSFVDSVLFYESMVIIDSSLNNYKSSLQNYVKYSELIDRSEKLDHKEKVAKLELAYSSEKKDKEIMSLQAAYQLKESQAQTDRYFRTGLISGGVFLLVLLFILYSRYRIKNKSVKVIQQQKEAIEEKSKENELLVREIHHRVKNNLQIILSLLNARSSSDIDKTSIEDFIGESQNRIKSMALVHQDLYLSESLVQVDSMSYLQKLLDNIKRSYLCDKENIEFRTNIIDERISMRLAVPIGLIVNELVTNSCKYAFCNESPDKVVTVNFSKSSKDAAYQLEVFDNGNGLPKNIDLKAMNSFGLQMVRGLVDQLNGSLEIIKKGGTGYNILVNS